MDFIAIDFETALNQQTPCSLGIAIVKNGQITDCRSYLIDPESKFSSYNMQIHGIHPEDVAGQPTFPQLWETIRPILEQGILVAHNAPFDMSVLAKCLRDYGLSWHKRVPYACTCQMSRRLIPQSHNHKLNTLCDYFGLELDHHHAGSDSRACGEIFFRCVETGADVSGFVRTYDVERIRTEKRR